MTSPQIIGLVSVEGIRSSLDYMPSCVYRDYCNWVLNQPALAEEWAQLVGIVSLTRLTFNLLQGLLSEDELDALIPYVVQANVFNMYEVLSDNLAIGLAHQSEGDTTFSIRRQTVRALNTAMIIRLRGAKADDAQSGLRELPTLNEISVFDQSLSPDKHRAIASAFAQQHPDLDVNAVEFALYPNLVTNIEACKQLVDGLQGYLTQEIVQNGFIRRYAGLNRLLDDNPISPNYLIQIGANTIMVTPFLGYYIAVIAEEIHLIHNYEAIVDNGLLAEALEGSALLTRLLNDLGPALLEQTDSERADLINKLQAEQNNFPSFHDLLLHVAAHSDVTLTRLKKDVKFGEFNLALYEPYRCASVSEAINSFHEQLNFLSRLYNERWARLHETLSSINSESASTIISEIILRFIEFHEIMYRTASEQPDGEFAV